MSDARFQRIQEAIKLGDLDRATKLLLRFIKNAEQRVREGKDYAVGSWPYERLAIIYRKRNEFSKEVELLLSYIDSEERRAREGTQIGVVAWPYDRLAKLFHKIGEYAKEVEIIKRFIAQPKYPGRAQQYLPARLGKAEELAMASASPNRLTRRAIAQQVANRSQRFIAFDIEIAKILPDNTGDLKAFRPLGICCAAVLEGIDDHPHLWYSRGPDGAYAPRMTVQDAKELVRFLCQLVEDGATLVTWNGLGFDFDILAEESGLFGECKTLALNHVDLMFHIFCEQGHPVSLNSVSQALGVGCKPNHIVSATVPRLWSEAKCEEVLDYVANDCRLLLRVFHECNTRRAYEWITQRGTCKVESLPHGWLKVCYAVNIPEPDTTWMTRPFPRSKFLGWTTRANA